MAAFQLQGNSGKHEGEKMGNAQKQIAEFGPLDIIHESFTIYKNNAKALIYIQLTLALVPVILTRLLSELFVLYVVSELTMVALGSSLEQEQHFLPPSPSVLKHEAYSGPVIVMALGLPFLLSIVLIAIDSLSMSANIYAVGAVFIGKRVPFLSVLKGAIPRLWKRLVLTQLCLLLTLYFVIFVIVFLFVLFWDTALLSKSVALNFIAILILLLGFGAVCFYLPIMSLVSSVSSILDEKYGWAAIKASPKLSHGRMWVAFRVISIYSMVFGLFSLLYLKSRALFNSPWHPIRLLLTAMESVLLIFVKQLYTISRCVVYMSFKAYHKETLSSDFFLKGGTDDYERLTEHDADGENRV